MKSKKYSVNGSWLEVGDLRIKMAAIDAFALDVDDVTIHLSSGATHKIRGLFLDPENTLKAASEFFTEICHAFSQSESAPTRRGGK